MFRRRFSQKLSAAIGAYFDKLTVDDFHYVLTAVQRRLVSANDDADREVATPEAFLAIRQN